MDFASQVTSVCEHALSCLGRSELRFRPMRRVRPVKRGSGYAIARTNLKTKLITIDILTPRKRQPKKISSILRSLAHEVAHHQKPPYIERFRGRLISRQHYPRFYRQVKKNIVKLKKDKILQNYFE